MANKQIFSTVSKVPATTTVNRAGGAAYTMADEHALAQYACTGTFNDTFYATAEMQVTEVLALAQRVPTLTLAKTAIYARQHGFMKDMPAFLLAVLSTRDVELFKKTFNQVIDNGKMLRNFVQIMRSGVVGRKSLGTAPKRMVTEWLEARTDEQLMRDSVGNDPSLADVIAMVHPAGGSKTRQAFYGYILGRTKHTAEDLPQIVKDFEAFKKAQAGSRTMPNVPFELVTALDLSDAEWSDIAKNARWHMTRMNLNTFARHNVFKDGALTKQIAERLKSANDIKHAKVFPYQLLTAFQNTGNDIPAVVRNALQDAMEVATENVPSFPGKVYVAVDVSGSMGSPITGYRAGASSVTTCRDVAALIASCVLRKADDTQIFAFDTRCRELQLNARDSVMTNAQKISLPGGGTDCSVVLRHLNSVKAKGDLVILVSDNESWVTQGYYGSGTGVQNEWKAYKARNPKAKLVCIDLLANSTTQAVSSTDTLNIGGFSDRVFEVIAGYVQSGGNAQFWTDKINATIVI